MSNAIAFSVRTGLAADILTEAVPGWSELRGTATRLRAEVIRRQQDQPATLDEHRAISDALLAAKDAKEIEKALQQARIDAARREASTEDITRLAAARDRAEGELNRLERGSVHEVTAVIRERVEHIADQIRGLKARPLSAQEAIERDAVAEWKQIQQLASEWQALVSAYSALCRHGIDGPALSALAPAAFIADPLNAHPFFQGRRRAAGKANDRPRPDSFHSVMLEWSATGSAPQFSTDEPRGNAIPIGADPVAWLVYLVDQDAATVHNPDHALVLWKAAMACTDDITAHSAESRALARGQHAHLIGDDQLTTISDLEPILRATPKRRRGAVFA
ncbi:hypothetical protein [Kocuria sabuli]|uniref:hypothetical protein n=1 Tax=Kocuria sabuli TaxID=3071448 RepID=UPI0034D4D6B5